MPALTDKIIAFLKANHANFDIITHEPVSTSLEAAAVRPGLTVGNGAKAMILKKSETGFAKPMGIFFMVVLPGDRRVDYKKVREFLKVSDVRLASPEEVFEVAGVKIGAVPPFGNLIGLEVLLDLHLLEKELIAFNAGSHEVSITLPPSDLIKALSPKVGDFSKI